MGIRKHGLSRARLEKWPTASPLSVAIFLLILKLFSSSVQSQECDFKTTVLKKSVLCSLVCFGRRNRKFWCLLFSADTLQWHEPERGNTMKDFKDLG